MPTGATEFRDLSAEPHGQTPTCLERNVSRGARLSSSPAPRRVSSAASALQLKPKCEDRTVPGVLKPLQLAKWFRARTCAGGFI